MGTPNLNNPWEEGGASASDWSSDNAEVLDTSAVGNESVEELASKKKIRFKIELAYLDNNNTLWWTCRNVGKGPVAKNTTKDYLLIQRVSDDESMYNGDFPAPSNDVNPGESYTNNFYLKGLKLDDALYRVGITVEGDFCAFRFTVINGDARSI